MPGHRIDDTKGDRQTKPLCSPVDDVPFEPVREPEIRRSP
jgi:hypothetical protein